MLSEDERYLLHSMDRLIAKAKGSEHRVVIFMVQRAAWTKLLGNIAENFEHDPSAVGPDSYRGIPIEFHNSDARKIYFRDEPGSEPA